MSVFNNWRSFLAFLFAMMIFSTEANSCALPDSLPKGWRANDSLYADMVVGLDTTEMHSGKSSGFLFRPLTIAFDPKAVVHLFQLIVADPYRGKKLRLTAYAKSKDAGSAIFYMRVEGVDTGLTFSNTSKTPIIGTTEWTAYQLTVEVPHEGSCIFFGAVLTDGGTLWVDDLRFDIVDSLLPSEVQAAMKANPKNRKRNYSPNKAAMNLGFEEK